MFMESIKFWCPYALAGPFSRFLQREMFMFSSGGTIIP